MENNNNTAEKQSSQEESVLSRTKIKRRDILKTLSTIPVFGVFISEFIRQQLYKRNRKKSLLKELDLDNKKAPKIHSDITKSSDQVIRVGIIGCGRRGRVLLQCLGYAHPEWIMNGKMGGYSEYIQRMNQDNIYAVVTGVCDVFDLNAKKGLEIAKSPVRPEYISGSLPEVKRYHTYREMLDSDEIDAVIIATPDHHHAQMTIDAAKAGKHVYCEKCMTRTEDESREVRKVIDESNIVFQLGHQYSQSASFFQAKQVIEKNILGKITLVETSTNRNTPKGAWIRHLDKKGNPYPCDLNSIDWKQWLGSRPEAPFSPERFYNWQTYWDYCSALVGVLFSHEYDAVNQLLGLGIPKSVVASGGIYYYKDFRETPDVFHAVFEFPDREITVLYSASLASSRSRSRMFMGSDASMELGSDVIIKADQNSTRYKQKIEQGIVDPSRPMFNYRPGSVEVDAVTSATSQYYANRGLISTYIDGKTVNTSYLHMKEWLDVIRNGGELSCGIQKGYEESMTCHMANRSYLEKRRVEWDPVNERIV